MALHFAASAAEQQEEEEEEDGAERERRLIGFRQRRVSRFGGRATSERVSAPSSRFKSDAAMASKAAAARRSYVSEAMIVISKARTLA